MVKRKHETHQVSRCALNRQVFCSSDAKLDMPGCIPGAFSHLGFVNLYGNDICSRYRQLPRKCTIACADVHSANTTQINHAGKYIKMVHAAERSAAAITGQGMMTVP